jgi:hypothetical protein
MTFVVAAQLANVMWNRSRQKRAENQLQSRWVPEPSGSVMVSDRRLFFSNRDTSFSLWWSALDSINMEAVDRFSCGFSDDAGGRHALLLNTCWAAMMFTMAAHSHFPAHPVLMSGDWLPRGFEEKCHLAGKACPSVRHQ